MIILKKIKKIFIPTIWKNDVKKSIIKSYILKLDIVETTIGTEIRVTTLFNICETLKIKETSAREMLTLLDNEKDTNYMICTNIPDLNIYDLFRIENIKAPKDF